MRLSSGFFGVAQVLDDQADFAAQHVAFQLADAGQVELVDELAVDLALELVEFFGLGGIRRCGRQWEAVSSG